ncbi:MAG: hypothetical protein ABR547_05160, partial [Halanaerobium sp.]
MKNILLLPFEDYQGEISGYFKAAFDRSQIVSSSEIMDCGEESCPDFDRDGVTCWFDLGSYAPEFGKEVHCPKIKTGEYEEAVNEISEVSETAAANAEEVAASSEEQAASTQTVVDASE